MCPSVTRWSRWSAPAPSPGRGRPRAAVEGASKSLRDLRVAEVVEQDVVIEKGKVTSYRTKLKLSFKYEGGDA